MNKIWVGVVVFCLFYGILSKNTKAMMEAIFLVPEKSLNLLIKIGGLIVFYNGLFQIAIEAGVIDNLARIFKKPINKLFPKLDKNSEAIRYICANITANLLGLGVGAIPMGIKSLEAMKKENNDQEQVTSSMLLLMVLNITSFTLFPVTILTIREIYKAKITIGLIPYIIFSTLILTVIGVFMAKLVRFKNEE